MILVTGGAGFIGSSVCEHLLALGEEPLAFDNFSRRGSAIAARRLKCKVIRGDVRDARAVDQAAKDCEAILHFAAMTSIPESFEKPDEYFAVNAAGTLNVLEAARQHGCRVLLGSSSRVFSTKLNEYCYETESSYRLDGQWEGGFDESVHPTTDPQYRRTPYGASKLAAELYALEYAHAYDLSVIVDRLSCVYGPWQLGTELQGWVAWLCAAKRTGRTFTVFGNGKQVRDLLYIDDLRLAIEKQLAAVTEPGAHLFHVGGGTKNARSLISVAEIVEDVAGKSVPPMSIRYSEWRQADRRAYVSDVSKLSRLDWQPTTSVECGMERVWRWLAVHGPFWL